MDTVQFSTILGLLGAGFAWLIIRMELVDSKSDRKYQSLCDSVHKDFESVHKDLTDIKTRLSIVETILSMMGVPLRVVKDKENECK